MLRLAIFLIVMFCIGCDSNPETSPDEPDDASHRTAYVTYVYDGDTIEVDGGEKVRYIGIDTPEQKECFYSESASRNGELVYHRTVELEICKDSPVDQYGRTLAHVFVGSVLINAVLVEEGYAEAFRVPPCTDRADYYQQLENEARQAGRGRWSACP